MNSSKRPESVAAEDLVVVRLRHPWRIVSGVVILVLLAMLVHTLITNSKFQWPDVRHYFTYTAILHGLFRTLLLTAVAMAIGIVGGTALAVMRLSHNRLASAVASAYIWFFRGTPVLVQLIFWFNLSALYPKLSLGVPFGPAFVSGSANSLIGLYTAAILGLGLNEAAYMAEIVRSGITAVDPGQTEAASALGLSWWATFRTIVLPQSMRMIIPPTGNQVIGMLKTTSLVSVIALPDLLYSAQLIYNRNFNPIPLLIVVSIWYLILTSILSVGQYYIERHFNRGRRTSGSARTRRQQRFVPTARRVTGEDDPGSAPAEGRSGTPVSAVQTRGAVQ